MAFERGMENGTMKYESIIIAIIEGKIPGQAEGYTVHQLEVHFRHVQEIGSSDLDSAVLAASR